MFGFLMPHRAETPKTRSQQHLARRATPVLDSIQWTHASLDHSHVTRNRGKTCSAPRFRPVPFETAIAVVYVSPRTRGPLDPPIGLPAAESAAADQTDAPTFVKREIWPR